ncbi:MAG: preprotein translocase subunit SecA [Planctomycetota bacterium]
MVATKISHALSRVFGSRNDRLIKSFNKRVARINEQEPAALALTDAELRAKTDEFKQRIADGEKVASLLPEIMAVAREAMDRYVGIRQTLNPEFGFDPSVLPEAAQQTYAQAVEAMKAIEPEAVAGGHPAPPWLQVELPNSYYEAVREAYPESRPPFRARPFDVQLIGGMVLGEGSIAEMRTGEGKTIVAPLACYVACVEGLYCHVVTVNDYLVQRDRDWVFPFYYGLGLTVGAIHPQHMQPPPAKAEAYQCNVVYGTNAEFGFDYLRDNMKLSARDQVQKHRDFCIIDEVDSILIDEARTPLIISGPAHQDAPKYPVADGIARHLIDKQRPWNAVDAKVQKIELEISGLEGDIRNTRDKSAIPDMRKRIKTLAAERDVLAEERDQNTRYYEVEMERKAAHLTHEGVAEAQKKAGIGSFYVGDNMDMPHLLENALRAHAVYKRDKEYVVKDGEVVIVDENTGRLMVGRQWSDGLHQAIETKESVKIKEETQTLATVTIQNFFKLYQRLAGMTGTAITEATEFSEIYQLEVVAIPTNRPIARADRDDLVFMGQKDKWEAILDEIKRMHDMGRPVLVGTTSVEKSEMLAGMLKRREGIRHEVLNAKQHEREADIVENAGQLGSVMIATNMAGRGTDIKLRPVSRAELVRHWQQRDMLPSQADASMDEDALLALSYRHQAIRELGVKRKEAEGMADEDLKLQLFQKWCEVDAWVAEKKAQKLTLDECVETLDALPDYTRHRLQVWDHIADMGGLHIVGTERHESRRIDNQLRGRSGRQGDSGSSRFFLSLEDDLMAMVLGEKTKAILSKLGMKEGDAIEHGMVSRSVERAQRKVEERNYQMRKTLLDYDEVMEHQRGSFYGTRQNVLEGKGVKELIFEYIEDAVYDAADTYLAPDYSAQEASAWVRGEMDLFVDPARIPLDDLDSTQQAVREAAVDDAHSTIDLTLGEYMSDDLTAEEWDLRGLSSWAMSRFGAHLTQSKLREMNPHEVAVQLQEAAETRIAAQDLAGLARFLEPKLGARAFADWAQQKFSAEVDPGTLAEKSAEEAAQAVIDQAREAYAQRERAYPVEYAMAVFTSQVQHDQNVALDWLFGWAKSRFGFDWTPDKFAQEVADQDLSAKLLEINNQLMDTGLDQEAEKAVAEAAGDPDKLRLIALERFGERRLGESKPEPDEDPATWYRKAGTDALRVELSMLEADVLLRILDQAWKDHLYAMDQLRDSINLRGYAERDPRIEYKREGAAQFQEMQSSVRDRVTELIFRVRMSPQVRMGSVYGQGQASHPGTPASPGTPGVAGPVGAAAGRPQANVEGARPMTRRHRRARKSSGRSAG